MSGEIVWKSTGGWMEGITIRRPKIVTVFSPNNEILRIESGGRLNVFHCVFDNHGSIGNCVSMVGSNYGGRWEKTSITGGSTNKSGLHIEKNARAELIDVSVLWVSCSILLLPNNLILCPSFFFTFYNM